MANHENRPQDQPPTNETQHTPDQHADEQQLPDAQTSDQGGQNVKQAQAGSPVLTSDGQKIGDVFTGSSSMGVGEGYVITQKKKFLFMHEEKYIPTSAIADIEDDRVVLNMSKDEVSHQNWSQPPNYSA